MELAELKLIDRLQSGLGRCTMITAINSSNNNQTDREVFINWPRVYEIEIAMKIMCKMCNTFATFVVAHTQFGTV